MTKTHRPGLADGMGLAFWLIVSFTAAWAGSHFQPGVWYERLNKPALTPPSWVFGPVWMLLYTMMGVAAWLVWQRRHQARVILALSLFFLQLGLNALWSYLFFGIKNPGLALLDLFALWLALLATFITFFRHRQTAGMLLLPYLLWVSFAVYLNLQFWRLNP
ncbi:MAG: TspO/MBR family protein [Desulfobacteraceae bacterium]